MDNKKTVRTLINEEVLKSVTGGSSSESWLEKCPDCFNWVEVSDKKPMSKHRNTSNCPAYKG